VTGQRAGRACPSFIVDAQARTAKSLCSNILDIWL